MTMDRYCAPILVRKYVEEDGRMCDIYFDPRKSAPGAGTTSFDKEKLRGLNYYADMCLERFNQHNNRNFVLVEIVKLNCWQRSLYFTFVAREAETDTTCHFRGVIAPVKHVAVCEIKEDGAAGLEVPPEHDESYDPSLSDNLRLRYREELLDGLQSADHSGFKNGSAATSDGNKSPKELFVGPRSADNAGFKNGSAATSDGNGDSNLSTNSAKRPRFDDGGSSSGVA